MIHGNVTVPPGSCSGTVCWRQVCGRPDGATGSSSLENSILILLALPAIRLCSESAPWGGPITAGHSAVDVPTRRCAAKIDAASSDRQPFIGPSRPRHALVS
jgi:hypothetical protein